ncbi:MAG: 16S rRNA (guanine(966)-N(2))-methyltransferase RsmD [Pseudomonadota bacterium]
MGARKPSTANEFRLIGGRFRRRKLRFAEGSTARPTPGRVRETLFNWLAPHIEGLRVLDLFAGSGALGLEAWSRGAGQVTLIERDARLVRSIEQNIALLEPNTRDIVVHCALAEAYIPTQEQPVDLVFLDPPFDAHSHGKLCTLLELHRSITPGGWCYREMSAGREPDPLPQNWDVVRDKRAGNVRYQLIRVAP